MKGYSKDLVAARIELTIVSFVFVFPYVGFIVDKHFANITEGPISVSRLAPGNPINLLFLVGQVTCKGL